MERIMRKNVLFAFLFLIVIHNFSFGQTYESDKFHKFIYKDKIGFIDEGLKVMIPTVFDKAENFENGLAIVTVNNKIQVIDDKEKILVSDDNVVGINKLCSNLFLLTYNDRTHKIFNSDNKQMYQIDGDDFYASPKKSNNVNFIDSKDNQFFTAIKYDKKKDCTILSIYSNNMKLIHEFCNVNCHAPVSGGYIALHDEKDHNNQSSLYSIDGNLLIKGIIEGTLYFSEGLIGISIIKDSQHKELFINAKGNTVFEIPENTFNHNDMKVPPQVTSYFSEGVIYIPNALGKAKIFDNKGNCLFINNKYERIEQSSNGLLLACERYRPFNDHSAYGYIDKEGKEKIPFIFDEAESFYNGYACVVLKGQNGILDTKGNFINSSDIVNKDK